jgi:uncharacterized membrane protein YuzA (DUF378 family)
MKKIKKLFEKQYALFAFAISLFVGEFVSAQTSNAGQTAINTMTNEIKGYMSAVVTLLYVICGILGIIGIIRCYIALQKKDQDATGTIAGWVGSVLFVFIAATVLSKVFKV